MKFKVVGKKLILTDYSHEITEGENCFDTVEIAVPNSHEVTFMLTGVSNEKIVAKFQSDSFTISDDISITSLPNETTAEQLFNQAQLEVQKAINAADRAEIASKTPAPAQIYPATTEILGGVKVDGKTIDASADGTISVSGAISGIADLSVQIAHPNNFLIYDNVGKPSVMVAIPKFYLDEVIDGASHTVHPAFIINGVEQDVIYISKYQNVVENERAYSLPMRSPQTYVSFNQAYNYCKDKGAGWHLMTNAEWAAIALWCRKNDTVPKGNNNYGKDISETKLPQKAIAVTYGSDGKINKVLSGSGPASWYHDGTFSGIADLNGNIHEWCSGLRLVDGEIQILANNDAADFNNSVSAESALWKAVLPNGSFVSPKTTGTVKYGTIWNNEPFGNIYVTPAATETGAVLLESLGIIPHAGLTSIDYENDSVWGSRTGETISMRGSSWLGGASAGMFALSIASGRSNSGASLGFRSAYYKI